MPFEIPNNTDVTESLPYSAPSAYQPQAVWYRPDIAGLVSGIAGDGVLVGCAVTAQGTPNMTVAVSAGERVAGNTKYLLAATSVTITTADATHPRIDLIVGTGTTAAAITGTAAANPAPPDVSDSDDTLLAQVYVPAGVTAITSSAPNLIIDKRVFTGKVVRARPKLGTDIGYTIPGVTVKSNNQYWFSDDKILYAPFRVDRPIEISRLAVHPKNAGDTRAAIYHADADFQPTSLVIQSAPMTSVAEGLLSDTVSAILYPGVYLEAARKSFSGELRTLRGTMPESGINWIQPFVECFFEYFIASGTAYGAFPSMGIPWDTIGDEYEPTHYPVVMSISSFL